MIWMGVGGPGDSNALGNRFPSHGQWVTRAENDRVVAACDGLPS